MLPAVLLQCRWQHTAPMWQSKNHKESAWLVLQHVQPASHTHCSAWPSTMNDQDEHQHDALLLKKPAPELNRLLLASNSCQLLALRSTKSRVHAPAQHQTTTSQVAPPNNYNIACCRCKMLIPAQHLQPEWWHTTTNICCCQSLT